MKTDYQSLEIIDDSSDEEYVIPKIKSKKIKVVKEKVVKEKVVKEKPKNILKGYYNEDDKIIEIGVDEVGRGPLFGRVYTAAVILPKDDNFDFSKVKDSKKFYSKKKLEEASEYVKNNALAWHVSYEDEKKIDEINILQATQLSMHNYHRLQDHIRDFEILKISPASRAYKWWRVIPYNYKGCILSHESI